MSESPTSAPTIEHSLKRLQPYQAKASRHSLAILADLSNADKHRLINPTYSFMASDTSETLDRLRESHAGPGRSPIKGWRIIKSGERMEHNTPWFRIEFHRDVPGPINVKVGRNPTVGIGLGEVGLDAMDFPGVAKNVLEIIPGIHDRFPGDADRQLRPGILLASGAIKQNPASIEEGIGVIWFTQLPYRRIGI